VPIEKLNPLFGYQSTFHPQGFTMVNEVAIKNFTEHYGDILGVLKTLERGEELIHLPARKETFSAEIDQQIERVSTGHDEMQWRLIAWATLRNVTSGSLEMIKPSNSTDTSSVTSYSVNFITR
jgi:hypothetical protein